MTISAPGNQRAAVPVWFSPLYGRKKISEPARAGAIVPSLNPIFGRRLHIRHFIEHGEKTRLQRASRTFERAMRLVGGIFVVGALCSLSLSQPSTIPTTWTGIWILNVKKSTFGPILIPGVPANLRIVGQTLKIEQAGDAIRLSADTVISNAGASQTTRDDNRLQLDGSATNVGPVSLSFRRVDDSSFEIVSVLNIPNHNVGGSKSICVLFGRQGVD